MGTKAKGGKAMDENEGPGSTIALAILVAAIFIGGAFIVGWLWLGNNIFPH